MFDVGDKAVYPGHGVGVIEAIESKTISGREQLFFILRIFDNGMTIMIPTENVDVVGLREVVPSVEIPRVLDILKERQVILDSQTWNRRYREYMDKIHTGSIFSIAEVLRDLQILKMEKNLSFGERKILDTAESLLVRELAAAKDINESDALMEIRKIFEP
jgi:CarD family transcriptional regulator